jgi:hypothetical protein
MPADFFIDGKLGVVFSKAWGILNKADGYEHMDRLVGHPEFDPKFRQLFDFREVIEVDLTGDEIRILAKRNIFQAPSRRAFVVRSKLHFGLARMFEIYREVAGEEGIMVFAEMQEAVSWLGLSAEPEARLFARLGLVAGMG